MLIALTVAVAAGVAKKIAPQEIAPFPPMQWHSWGLFTYEDLVNEQNMGEIADALISSGMAAAGYCAVVFELAHAYVCFHLAECMTGEL